MVIVDYKVVTNKHITAGFDWQPGSNEGKNATGIVVDVVAFYQSMAAVLNLNARNTVKDFVVNHVDMI